MGRDKARRRKKKIENSSGMKINVVKNYENSIKNLVLSYNLFDCRTNRTQSKLIEKLKFN